MMLTVMMMVVVVMKVELGNRKTKVFLAPNLLMAVPLCPCDLSGFRGRMETGLWGKVSGVPLLGSGATGQPRGWCLCKDCADNKPWVYTAWEGLESAMHATTQPPEESVILCIWKNEAWTGKSRLETRGPSGLVAEPGLYGNQDGRFTQNSQPPP